MSFHKLLQSSLQGLCLVFILSFSTLQHIHLESIYTLQVSYKYNKKVSQHARLKEEIDNYQKVQAQFDPTPTVLYM